MNNVPIKIQIISIIISFAFLAYISRLIIKGKLREEYSFVWVLGTILLLVFSFWRNGLEVMARLMGVLGAPNLVFMACIFVILVYLLHLSVVVSKLQANNKNMAQQIALLENKLNKLASENKETDQTHE